MSILKTYGDIFGCVGAGMFVAFAVFDMYLIEALQSEICVWYFMWLGLVTVSMVFFGCSVFVFCRRQMIFVRVQDNLHKLLAIEGPVYVEGSEKK